MTFVRPLSHWHLASAATFPLVPRAGLLAALLALLPIGCSDAIEPPEVCRGAEIGGSGRDVPCLARVRTAEEFLLVSVPAGGFAGFDRVAKFLVPYGPGARVDALVANTRLFPLHEEFLRAVFPSLFSELTTAAYRALVSSGADDQLVAGSVGRLDERCGFDGYGFFVAHPATGPRLSAAEVEAVRHSLSEVLAPSTVAFAAITPEDRDEAMRWAADGLFGGQVIDCTGDAETRVYQPGLAYGRLRLMSRAAFVDADDRGAIAWDDIVVVEALPPDIATFPAAIVTGTQQGPLSHVSVRMAGRGAPNAFVRDAAFAYSALAGRLVRILAQGTSVEIVPATEEEAERWRTATRPDVTGLAAPDTAVGGLPDLRTFDVATPAARSAALRRYGGKATNLMTLAQHLPDELSDRYVVPGFAIPFQEWATFMQSNVGDFVLDGQSQRLSYSEYAAALMQDPTFLGDSSARALLLRRFEDRMRTEGAVDPATIERVSARIEEVFGSRRVMVRFRSSSSLEDRVDFSGAGLYESQSACAADTPGASGRSQCDDATQRPVEDALRVVWASLWSQQAVEARLLAGIDDADAVAMGVLVTPRFKGEAASGVALTGDPAAPAAEGWLVTSQPDGESVVSPAAGVVPETAWLTPMGAGISVERRTMSTFTPRSPVIRDSEYAELAALLQSVVDVYPIDGDGASDLLLDLEFKLDASRDLWLKQIRPFRVTGSAARGVGTLFGLSDDVCSRFTEGRPLDEERTLRTRVTIRPGQFLFGEDGPLESGALVEGVYLGPWGESATPVGPPGWDVETSESDGELVRRHTMRQRFELGSRRVEVGWHVDFVGDTEGLTEALAVLDEGVVTSSASSWTITVTEGDESDPLAVSSCDGLLFPLYTHRVEMGGGRVAEFDVRAPLSLLYTAPALITEARVTLDDTRVVTDRFALVYGAGRHNTDERLLVAFDPPLDGVTELRVWTSDDPETPTTFAVTDVDGVQSEPMDATGYARMATSATGGE